MAGVIEWDLVLELVKRHGDHHFANVKYGNIALGASTVILAAIALNNILKTAIRSTLKRDIAIPLWLSVVIWALLAAGLSVFHVEEFTAFAKRLGRVSYGLLPVTFFLSIRPSPLPNTVYLQMIQLHKWVARIVVALATLHGVFFIIHFASQGELTKVFCFLNFLGVLAWVGFLVMTVTSFIFFRRRYYWLFYRLHYILSWVCVLLGIFHARPGVLFLSFWCLAILVGSIAYRIYISKTTQFTVSQVSTNLARITIPRDIFGDNFTPGSHVRISAPLSNLKTWISASRPYTIASLPSDGNITLITRPYRFHLDSHVNYSISGPYASLPKSFFKSASKVIVFAGGSGISYAAPVVRALLNRGNEENGESKIQQVSLIWTTRQRPDTAVLSLLQIEDADVYITGITGDYSMSDTSEDSQYKLATGNDFDIDDDNLDIELEDFLIDDDDDNADDDNLIANAAPISGSAPYSQNRLRLSENIRIHHGRPAVSTLVEQFVGPQDRQLDSIWAIACGPPDLVFEVEKWAKRSKIRFGKEIYAM
ncbi:hypothetical protein NADFUDRAFT_81492 [Nadsonia fulvescens var. elongata DSM 6958]|uniref:FAD-binding FR-type domain-containing protein n=1 Tax=Nadsonia fulvescens var. elongata DSM 6958 TaxID=857566 RepID=A0A1E3PUF0_9ASCO|nr:hypothetical protein NADFUDRAFT_81492 [Nadsonia fulvescens var. elongata DSM 6958]